MSLISLAIFSYILPRIKLNALSLFVDMNEGYACMNIPTSIPTLIINVSAQMDAIIVPLC